METLEELKNKYNKLQEESNRIYSKIKILEKQDKISKFTVGDCYLDRIWNNLLKIVSIKNNFIYYICLDDGSISRESIYVFDIELWGKDYFRTIQKCLSCFNERYSRSRLW